MLIHSASQLITLADGPQRGHQLGQLGLIPNAAILIEAAVASDPGRKDPHTPDLVW